MNSGLYAPPQFTIRSSGTWVVLWEAINNNFRDYSLGIAGSTLRNSIPSTAETCKCYAWATNIMSLYGSGSLRFKNFSDPRMNLTHRSANPAQNSYGICMQAVHPGGYAVQMLAVKSDGGANFSGKVAPGNGNWTASEVLRLTQERTTINNQVGVTNDTLIFYDRNNIQYSSEGAFKCNGEALFHNQVCISGRSTKPNSGTYRTYGLDGIAIYSLSGNKSLIIGKQGRILCAAGSELNT